MWLCDYVDVILNSLFASILVEHNTIYEINKQDMQFCRYNTYIVQTLYVFAQNVLQQLYSRTNVHLVRTSTPSQNLSTQSELVYLVRTCSPSQNLSTQSELVHLVRTCSPSQNSSSMDFFYTLIEYLVLFLTGICDNNPMEYVSGHILILSHARAYHLYNNKYRLTQGGMTYSLLLHMFL